LPALYEKERIEVFKEDAGGGFSALLRHTVVRVCVKPECTPVLLAAIALHGALMKRRFAKFVDIAGQK
jgi:hypothetical protein